MANDNMPQITKAAYSAVREAFRKTLPVKVTPTWVMTNVTGYKAQTSARTLTRYLCALGLTDADGVPTEIAKKWRIDESYGEACEAILRSGFPADVVDAVPTESSAEVLVNVFMTRGLGEGSAKNLASIYRLIASKAPPEARAKKPSPSGNGVARPKTHSKQNNPNDISDSDTALPIESVAPPVQSHETGVAVLRYFLDRGRMAEI